MGRIIKIKTAIRCYVCGKEIGEDDIIDGPDLPICNKCFNEWQNRCYKLLDQMKDEAHGKQ